MHTELTMSCPRTSTNERTNHRPSWLPTVRQTGRTLHTVIRFLISTQAACGDGPQEGVTGVCNNHGMITYMNGRREFPIR